MGDYIPRGWRLVTAIPPEAGEAGGLKFEVCPKDSFRAVRRCMLEVEDFICRRDSDFDLDFGFNTCRQFIYS